MRDPVCGKVVDPLRARAVGIYGGTTQYFCSPECKASYGDPRTGPTVSNAGPGGSERRYTDQPLKDVAGDESGQWFMQPRQQPPPPVERFADLELPPPIVEQAPSPSIMIDVRAARSKRPILLVAVIVAVVVGALLLALRAHAG